MEKIEEYQKNYDNNRQRWITKIKKIRTNEIKKEITIALAALAGGGLIFAQGSNFVRNFKEDLAKKPVNKEVQRIIRKSEILIPTDDRSKGLYQPAYDHRTMANEVENVFEQSDIEGKIVLGQLNRNMAEPDYNMPFVFQNLDDKYDYGALDFESYVTSLGYNSVDEYYDAMEAINANLPRDERGKTL